MIALQATNQPSPHIKQRARTMRVKTLAFDSYLVTPREPGKAKRLVQFDISNQGVVRVECVKQNTEGELCEANAFSKHCAHVEAAIRRLTANIKKLSDSQNTDRSKRVRRAIKQTTSKRLKFNEPTEITGNH